MKMFFSKKVIYLLVSAGLVCIIAISCRTSQTAFDPKDLSYLYNPTKNPINPRYNITNQSDELTTLAVKFFTSELHFSEANPQGIPMAMLLITVKLYNTSQGRVLADTAYYNINIVKEEGNLEYVYNIPLKVAHGFDYVAEVKILDRIRLQVVQAFVPFNTLTYANKYNFRAQGHFRKNDLFDPVLKADEYVNLVYLRTPPDSLFVSFYKPFSEVPYPPSMLLPEKTLDYEPDTLIALQYSDTMPIMFPNEGVFLCSTDRKIADGFTFYNFGNAYPAVNTPEVMIPPLAYLATEDEMIGMLSAQKPKLALDEFWIKCGGNVEKSRELIRIFYTRVQYSNFYFTSYKEGWRSERGMIYIIYGPPDKVYKTSDGERWGYRKPVIRSLWGTRYRVTDDYLYFNFRKKDNIFSDNDYYLSRSESLVTFWEQAIASWRKGMVFRLDNPEDI
ncbi:MAG: GWxTD domain-containing protein [Bacteroidales bacterium]|nr:GWxTD domain-containing protein [Bacteroidales bacterium]